MAQKHQKFLYYKFLRYIFGFNSVILCVYFNKNRIHLLLIQTTIQEKAKESRSMFVLNLTTLDVPIANRIRTHFISNLSSSSSSSIILYI